MHADPNDEPVDDPGNGTEEAREPSGAGTLPSARSPRPHDAVAYLDALVAGGPSDDSVATGFPSVDNLLGGGLRRGDLVALGGAVGSGKSALALAMAIRAAEAGRRVVFLSGEMSVERVIERALAIEGRLRIDDLRERALPESVRTAAAAVALRLRDSGPVIAQLPDGGVGGVSDLLIEHLGIELVIVDPLQSLATGTSTLNEDLARASRELKALAIRRSAAVLVVSHLPDLPHERPDPRPHLDDFGALGALKQHADVVLGLYREEMYRAANDIDGAAELHVLKHRGGPLGYADLYFYKQWLRFEDMLEPDR